MVGVSGRSKGCITCRQRKVKCDEARPTCNRCKNGYFICLGYTRPVTFISEDAKHRRKEQTVLVPATPATAIPDSVSSVPIPDQNNDDVLDTSNLPGMGLLKFENTPIQPPLHLNAFKDNILISHLMQNLFSDAEDTTIWTERDPWILYAIQHPETEPTSYTSVLALAATFFGRVHKEMTVFEQGTRSYSRALSQLKADLAIPERAVSYSTMASTLILSVYELVVFSNISGWQVHFDGIGALTELAGPYAYQSRMGIEIFGINRIFIALNAIFKKKRCFLEEEAWKTIPWARQRKHLGESLVDVFCDIPGFLEDSKLIQDLSGSGDDVTLLEESLRQRVTSSLERLYDVRRRWECAYPQACYELIPSPSETLCLDQNGNLLFDSTFHFWNMQRANEVIFYNGALLLHLRLLEAHPACYPEPTIKVEGNSLPSVQATNPLLLPGEGSIEDVAREICRLVDYFLLSRINNSGALQLVFPLKVIDRIFDQGSREGKWLKRLMRRIADINGFEISRYGLAPGSSNQFRPVSV